MFIQITGRVWPTNKIHKVKHPSNHFTVATSRLTPTIYNLFLLAEPPPCKCAHSNWCLKPYGRVHRKRLRVHHAIEPQVVQKSGTFSSTVINGSSDCCRWKRGRSNERTSSKFSKVTVSLPFLLTLEHIHGQPTQKSCALVVK